MEASPLVMSRQTFIFVGTQARDADLMHLMERTLGGTFAFEEGTDPYIRVGTVAVYVGEHDFDDDDIAWPGGSDVPLRRNRPAGGRPCTSTICRRSWTAISRPEMDHFPPNDQPLIWLVFCRAVIHREPIMSRHIPVIAACAATLVLSAL